MPYSTTTHVIKPDGEWKIKPYLINRLSHITYTVDPADNQFVLLDVPDYASAEPCRMANPWTALHDSMSKDRTRHMVERWKAEVAKAAGYAFFSL